MAVVDVSTSHRPQHARSARSRASWMKWLPYMLVLVSLGLVVFWMIKGLGIVGGVGDAVVVPSSSLLLRQTGAAADTTTTTLSHAAATATDLQPPAEEAQQEQKEQEESAYNRPEVPDFHGEAVAPEEAAEEKNDDDYKEEEEETKTDDKGDDDRSFHEEEQEEGEQPDKKRKRMDDDLDDDDDENDPFAPKEEGEEETENNDDDDEENDDVIEQADQEALNRERNEIVGGDDETNYDIPETEETSNKERNQIVGGDDVIEDEQQEQQRQRHRRLQRIVKQEDEQLSTFIMDEEEQLLYRHLLQFGDPDEEDQDEEIKNKERNTIVGGDDETNTEIQQRHGQLQRIAKQEEEDEPSFIGDEEEERLHRRLLEEEEETDETSGDGVEDDDDDDDDDDDTKEGDGKEDNDEGSDETDSNDDEGEDETDDKQEDLPSEEIGDEIKLTIQEQRRRIDDSSDQQQQRVLVSSSKRRLPLDRAMDTRDQMLKDKISKQKQKLKEESEEIGKEAEQDEKRPDAAGGRPMPHFKKLIRGATEAPMEADPLRAPISDQNLWPYEHNSIDMFPSVEYLGVLIDGGRHYFSMEWLIRLIDRLADMNYNLIQLRLTDDQAFNVLLESRPQLAYPTAVDNPDQKVWTVSELRELNRYAKTKGISIMPEINVPGHAGAWAGMADDIIVHCPEFICEKGYGIPLNVTHGQIRPILLDVIREVLDIFDDPPFLHLGGDEVNMADPCFHEVGDGKRFDYPAFEKILKDDILTPIGFPEDRIVRWEMTGQKAIQRTGKIEQFWESHPGDRHQARGDFFLSTWMYFDTNQDQNAYEVYTKAAKSFHTKQAGAIPKAIIAGTFELSEEFWFDRNVLGRLLAVAIGAARLPEFSSFEKGSTLSKRGGPAPGSSAVIDLWRKHCETLGLGHIICDTDGGPVISTKAYQTKWQEKWTTWKTTICQRLSNKIEYQSFKPIARKEEFTKQGNEFFWNEFPLSPSSSSMTSVVAEKPNLSSLSSSSSSSLQTLMKRFQNHVVAHTGVIFDLPSAMPPVKDLEAIITNYLGKMGFNLMQLRLVSNYGFVVKTQGQPGLAQSLISGRGNPLYRLDTEIRQLVQTASSVGIFSLPEIRVSTDAGGYTSAGTLANCPELFCRGEPISNDINNSSSLLPVIYSLVGELRKVFTSEFFHLGTDERQSSMACFEEAKVKPNFNLFEQKLETLMALADLSPNQIIRTANKEGVHYSDRAGRITQYPAGAASLAAGGTGSFFTLRTNTKNSNNDADATFLTIDILDGDAFQVFQNTQKAVALQPLGILAELRKLTKSKWAEWKIPLRLLAYAMGVSEMGVAVGGGGGDKFGSARGSLLLKDVSSFTKEFKLVCEALSLDPDGDCSPPKSVSNNNNNSNNINNYKPIAAITETAEFTKKACDVFTKLGEKKSSETSKTVLRNSRDGGFSNLKNVFFFCVTTSGVV